MLALFDLDNTLVDRAEGLRLWALEFCAGRGWGDGEAAWLVAADQDGLVRKEEFFARVRERFGLSESVEELQAAYTNRHTELIPVVPGVIAGLKRLRNNGWKVGCVTNGPGDQQYLTLTRTGLTEHLDGWAISGAEGIWKPDPRLFEIAARRCGAPTGGWMVGDSATSDVAGGKAAGLRTIWVDRGRPWPTGNPPPDHIVRTAADAVEILLSA